MAVKTTKTNKRTPIQQAKDKLRARLQINHKKQMKALDDKWRAKLKEAVRVAKMDATDKRERAAQRSRDTKERKRQRFWKKKADNRGMSLSDKYYGKALW